MALSQDLVSQFAKLTNNNSKQKADTTVNGVYKTIDGKEYVQIDGSDIWTPVTSTVEAETGERVTVLLKDHTATVTGNISSPSARTKTVENLKDEVDEHGNTIKQLDNSITQQNNSIIQMNNTIKQQNDTINSFGNTIDSQNNKIQQYDNTIKQHGDSITSMNNAITQHSNQIDSMNNTIESHNNTIKQHGDTIISQGNTISQQGNTISQQGNTINQHNTSIETANSNIQILNSGFKIENGVLTGLSEIVVDELETNTLNAKYANIDFANIEMAAVEKLFSDSGIIKDLIVNEGKITGELVGVTIKGDLIEGNTIKADKLVVKGEDGIYYKLNVNALGEATASSDEKYQNGLDGSVIVAKSLTADKVAVTDLVAFGATIGGFHIDDHSLYSGVKNSATNTTRGVFLGDDGELSIGDSNNYLRYFKDPNEQYIFEIGMGGSSIEETINTAQNAGEAAQSTANNTQATVNEVQSKITMLSNMIANLVTDENGGSMMTQTSDGWTFNMSSISGNLEAIQNALIDMQSNQSDTNNLLEKISNLVDSVAKKTAYITMSTDDNGDPCIELGKSDNLFKVRITNMAIDFLEGSSKIAYANNNTFYSVKIITEELQLGKGPGFVWALRANGNLGLVSID